MSDNKGDRFKKKLEKFGKKSLQTLGDTVANSHLGNTANRKLSALFSSERPPGERFYGYLLAIFIGYCLADLAILSQRDRFLPSSPPPLRVQRITQTQVKMRYDYDPIASRNPFNADGLIPEPISGGGQGEDPSNRPVLSSLPLALVGTIVHVNKAKSVATIEIKSGTSKVLAYFPNEQIENLATLLKVERKRAIFKNLSNGRYEYIEIKDDVALSLNVRARTSKGTEIKASGNQVSIPREELNEYMKNLPDLLQQATAVPNIVPGGGGRIDGFKVIDLDANSVFAKLGIKKDDVIKSVAGEPIDSPAKAMELYNRLRNDNRIQVDVERNGRVETLTFSIN